jgi:K+-transporting ATPase ATPase C chain
MNVARNLVVAVLMTLVTTVMLGVIYPLAITGIAQVAFPDRANGQLVRRDSTIIGSRLIGQGFAAPEYFHSRPSATATPYDAANSGGSQYGPTNKKLIDAVKANVEAARQDNPGAPVPIDLVTASASGVDPHISPAAADFQIPRVARARKTTDANVRRLVEAYTEGRQLGFLGEPRVNVLELNLALDREQPLADSR